LPRVTRLVTACSSLFTSKMNTPAATAPLVGLIMGSRSDWEALSHTAATLEELSIPYEARVVSAHRTPDLLMQYAAEAESRGIQGAADAERAEERRPARGRGVKIGVLGGGQLGRMLALAGYPLGLRFRFLDPARDAPAGQVGELFVGGLDDPVAVDAFARGLD